MSEVYINGQSHLFGESLTLEKLLEQQGYSGDGFAIALNGAFVPRAVYSQTEIQAGDQLDIVAPVVGG